MSSFFTRERFGKPQFVAGGLLLLFLLQCAWLISRTGSSNEVSSSELFRLEEGLRQWQGEGIAGTPSPDRAEGSAGTPSEIEDNAGYDPNHSPLWYLISALPLFGWTGTARYNPAPPFGWMARAPFILFGMLLGASLWYVARRLYGDMGGYIALTLYCFSPVILRQSVLWSSQPEIGAAWGTFGTVFTAIAVAHTLYAPREVILWNWRRILLLGVSLALAIGSQFSLVILIPVALAFMLYVAPTRQGAATVIWFAACVIAKLLLYAAYAFHPHYFLAGLRHAHFGDYSWRALTMPRAYLGILSTIIQSGAVVPVSLIVGLGVYLVWRRTRYFGNTAPLLVTILFMLLAVLSPHYPSMGFRLMAVPFLFVFIAGIAADLLETSQRSIVAACIWALLAVDVISNFLQLIRIGRG